MNGPQDLGGREGFGPVNLETNEPIFHADWERRALAVTLAAGAMGHWTIDESRATRENRHPLDYYGSSYYELWIKALESQLVRHGLISEGELAVGRALEGGVAPKRVLKAENVVATLARGAPVNRDPGERRPAFTPGDRVRTRNLQPSGHIRLPSYTRAKAGTIEKVQGFHVFPDLSAQGNDAAAEWLYTVTFEARTLWGEDAPAADFVSIDAWESYLERA